MAEVGVQHPLLRIRTIFFFSCRAIVRVNSQFTSLFYHFSYKHSAFFVVDGEEWKFQRKLALQVLNVNAFREYTSDIFVLEGQKVVDYLNKAADEGIVVDFQELMLHYTLDTFTR